MIEGAWTLVPMVLGIFTGIGAFAWLFTSAASIYDYLSTTRVAGRVVGTFALAVGAALCIYLLPDIVATPPGSHRRQGSATALIVITSVGLMLGWRSKRSAVDGP